jgi:hypothetical protein
MTEDQQQEPEENAVDVINIGSTPMRFEIDGVRYKLAPGEMTKIHKAYALPRQMQAGKDAVPSAVELLTNKQVLWVGDKRARARAAAVQQAK